MKKTMNCIALTLLLTGPARAEEALDDLFRNALFAEEGERNVEKAIKLYQQTLERFSGYARTAASATFRLAETHRKLGRNREAAEYYQTVLLQFPNEAVLVKLSRENLRTLGIAPAAPLTYPANPNPYKMSEEERSLLDWAEVARVNSPDILGKNREDNLNVLEVAARNGYLELTRFLLESQCFNLKEESDLGVSALYHAVRKGHLAVTRYLIEQGALKNGKPPGFNPLAASVKYRHYLVQEELLKHRPDLHVMVSLESAFKRDTDGHRRDPFAIKTGYGPIRRL
ncbi:MAG: ankyrin repeat domain-containing protein, partial [Verrucomicrobiota bacterium]